MNNSARPPFVNDRPTIEIIAVSDSGTGISDHSVNLLQFDGHTIRRLWAHPSLSEWDEPTAHGEETGKQMYVWHYEENGTKIFVRGEETEKLVPNGAHRSITRRNNSREIFVCMAWYSRAASYCCAWLRGSTSRISSASSSSTAPLQRATTRPPETSPPESIWQLLSLCSIEDRP